MPTEISPPPFSQNGYVHYRVAQLRPRDPAAEAYRLVRSNLLFVSGSEQPRRLLVTSPGPGDGKTSTATNLAITFAHAGERVLLVDADLRRPTVHRVFGVTAPVGLSSALAGRIDWREVVAETDVEGLSLLPAGNSPPNPAELLGTARGAEILREAGEAYDRVIVDSPPVLAVVDASLLARQVDGVILVLLAGKTRIEAAKAAAQQLRTASARILGTVINRVRRDGGGYGYYYGYYGHDGGEGSKADEQG